MLHLNWINMLDGEFILSLVLKVLIILSVSLGGDQKMVPIIGLLEIHGGHSGDIMIILD